MLSPPRFCDSSSKIAIIPTIFTGIHENILGNWHRNNDYLLQTDWLLLNSFNVICLSILVFRLTYYFLCLLKSEHILLYFYKLNPISTIRKLDLGVSCIKNGPCRPTFLHQIQKEILWVDKTW